MRSLLTRSASLLLIALALILAACGSTGAPGATSPTSTSTAITVATPTTQSSSSVSLSALPLGDGNIGQVKVGYVDSCQTTPGPGAGGSTAAVPWIHGDTWDETAKIAVQGSVSWPQAHYSATLSGANRIITTNDLPVGQTTGNFPISPSDPAYAYDRNPNSIQPQSLTYTLPANPTAAPSPVCLNMGPIGVLSDGVVLFNALDALLHDAPAHELQDHCGGHPERTGQYHYHEVSPCILRTATGTSTLVGYALDGYGIYVERDANGNLLTDADLDACHGRTSSVMWDGKQAPMYHYDATEEYPYTVGCYHGTPVR